MAVKSLHQECQAEFQCEGTKAALSPNCLHDKFPLIGEAQWFGPIGDTPGSGFEPASFFGAQGRVKAAGRPGWGRLGYLWPRGGSWWRKQGRVLGTSSPDLGILEARELRLL